MTERVPTVAEIDTLVTALRAQRDRLRALAHGQPPDAAAQLADAVDQIGEQLLVADEELRVQNEQLQQSTRQLDMLAAAHDELFTHSTAALLQTDADGVVLRLNEPARRLLGLSLRTSRTLVLPNLVSAADRGAMRGLISRLRLLGDGGARIHPVEATATRPDGTVLPLVFTGRRSIDDASGRLLLHWEVEARGAGSPAEASPRAPVAVQAVAEATQRVAGQGKPCLAMRECVVAARGLMAAADEVGLTLVRHRRFLENPAASGAIAAACDRLQSQLDTGPAVAAAREGVPVFVADFRKDARWPAVAEHMLRLGVRSVLAVPFAGSRGLAGALTLYAGSQAAFSAADVPIVTAFTTHAALVIAAAELEENLRIAIGSREDIGRAVGILMERHRVDSGAAFDMLVTVSQNCHVKLRDVAARLAETGEDLADIAATYVK